MVRLIVACAGRQPWRRKRLVWRIAAADHQPEPDPDPDPDCTVVLPQLVAVNLTGWQVRSLLAMRTLYLRNVGALLQHRRKLTARLQVLKPVTCKSGIPLERNQFRSSSSCRRSLAALQVVTEHLLQIHACPI
jgi:hypothetical protein